MLNWLAAWNEITIGLVLLVIPGLAAGWALGLRRFWSWALAPAISTCLLAGWPVVLAGVKAPWTWWSALATVVGSVGLLYLLRRVFLSLGWLQTPASWLTVAGPAEAVGAASPAKDAKPTKAAKTVASAEASMPAAESAAPPSGPVQQPKLDTRGALLGGVLAGIFGTATMAVGIRNPELPPQTWDAVFHLNAIRSILESGNGSMLHMGAFTSTAHTPTFYPAGFHDIAALMVFDDIILSTNVLALLLGGLVWPVGVAFAAAVFFPGNRVSIVGAAFAATTFTAFPERVASYGTLWPTLLAYALIPPVVAGAFYWYRQAWAPRSQRLPGELLVLALAGMAAVLGIGAAHPSGVFVLAMLLAPLVVAAWIAGACWWWVNRGGTGAGAKTSSKPAGRRHLVLVVLVAAPVLLFGLGVGISRLHLISSITDWERAPVGTEWREVVGAIFDSQLSAQGYGNSASMWLLGLAVLLGAVVSLRTPNLRWLAVSWAVASYFFVASAVVGLPGYGLTGIWYGDPVRLGAIVPLVGAPLAGAGLAQLVAGINRWSERTGRAQRFPRRPVAVAVLIAFVFGTWGMGFLAGNKQLRINYTPKNESGLNGLVTLEEIELMRRLPAELPADAKVIANPFNGSPLLYAIGGIDVVFPYFQGKWSPEMRELAKEFPRIDSDPQVCRDFNQAGVHYFYADQLYYWPEHERMLYYEGLDTAPPPGVTLVDQGDGAALYRLDLCR